MKPIVLACLLCIFVAWGAGMLWAPVQSSSIALEPHLSGSLGQSQQYGWQVCAIAEIGPIPGLGNRQKVELCHSDGWRIMTYCLDPDLPVPAVGEFCSQTSAGVFWCGDDVQRLQFFSIMETPGPQEATRTRTPTPSATPTRLPTLTKTLTRTALPQIEESSTPQASATPYYRPQAGGPGNLEVGGGMLAMLALGGGAWWFLRRRAQQAARGE